MADTNVIAHNFNPDFEELLGKMLPPLDHDAWWLAQKRLEAKGLPADKVETGIAIFKILYKLGFETFAEALDFIDGCDDIPGSQAWLAKEASEAPESWPGSLCTQSDPIATPGGVHAQENGRGN